MDLGITGKRALVLGGNRGIGQGIAQALVREGVHVAITGRDTERMKAAVAELKACNPAAEVESFALDLADTAGLAAFVSKVTGSFGAIDILVNNTGGPGYGGASERGIAEWTSSFNEMVLSVITLTDALLPGMRRRQWGRIMTVVSSGVVQPIPILGVSNTLRNALVTWSKTLSMEVAKDGVTVNVLVPGRIDTERVRMTDEAVAQKDRITVEEAKRRSTAMIPMGRVRRAGRICGRCAGQLHDRQHAALRRRQYPLRVMAGVAQELRLAIRQGRHRGLTTGHAPGHVQANLVVLPQRHVADFLDYCALNAFACPVLGVSEPGSPHIPALGRDLDVRTDLPGYTVHRRGEAPESVTGITAEWRAGMVAVAIGCWFSMEDALRNAGVRLRHVELGIQGPIFKTQVQTRGKGVFGGPLVVSMRPFAQASVSTVQQVTARFSRVHGGPVHVGDPRALGIADLGAPDFGEVLEPLPGELPMFWGCGLTATVALQQSGIDFFITHAPGRMLVTDCLNASLSTTPETEPESTFA